MCKDIILILYVLFLLSVFFDTAHASGSAIRKFCYTKTDQSQPLTLLISSGTYSQELAVKRNVALRKGRIFFNKKKESFLFHEVNIERGDCILLNLKESLPLEIVTYVDGHSKTHQTIFLPAVFYVNKNKSKQYGLIDKNVLGRLTAFDKHQETKTDEIINYSTNKFNDLVLIYILCSADRNTLCDLSIKRNGTWLLDAENGKKFSMNVLARSRRDENASGTSRRTHINSDTPQGVYSIWGAVADGGNSPWHQLARIDLDAALPPINGHSYNINSFLLSQIIPDAALGDYWVNEWPLAYSLGRVFLRIAPGNFESKQEESIQLSFGDKRYNATHGCINTGDKQKKLLQVLVQAGVFAQHEVFGRSGDAAAKKWYVASKLGKAFVILKDRD
ncbi:MAG: hypothetical protein D3924_08905 [Candidatus Electrothrix sp. AR4]|nr:hypothetical protein [Candidatus Electrothrix sp. AR4]